ncbi:MAG: hypothetical protein KA123_00610 [Candidatus Eisenbacteria bacterium]|nr:hypothetical protein [Candidatus Eisenbacteria bacterium]
MLRSRTALVFGACPRQHQPSFRARVASVLLALPAVLAVAGIALPPEACASLSSPVARPGPGILASAYSQTSRLSLFAVAQSPPASADTSLANRAQRAVERLQERMRAEQSLAPDSLAPADTMAARSAPGAADASKRAAASPPASVDSAAAEGKPGRFDSPTWVMARSLIVPGWGQAKNGAWWKAIAVAGIEGALLERLFYEARVSRDFERKAARFPEGSDERARYLSKSEKHARHRRDFTWWTALFVILSMGDAYVDAHLQRFDVSLQGGEDIDPETGGDGGGGSGPAPPGIRLGLRLAP